MKSHRLLLRLSLSLLLLCAAAHAAAAQTPAPKTTGGTVTTETMSTSEPWFHARDSIKGEIESVNVAENTVALRLSKTGARVVFHLDKRTRLSADKQTELAGRKPISLSDFKAGHRVKLTFRAADRKPIEMRLRADNKS